MQQDIWEAYQTSHPGQFQVIGADIYNGSAAQVQSFRNTTGATYPVLLQAADATGGHLGNLYGPNDNYVVISKQGIVRLNTYPSHAHGQRYQLEEIRGCIDTLLTNAVSVDGAATRALSLSALPNPFRSSSMVELAIPEGAHGRGRVAVFDLGGRKLATLWEGEARPGAQRVRWDGRGRDGRPTPPGVYLVRAEVGGTAITRRITRLK